MSASGLEQIAPGLHRWTAPHPDWTPDEGGPDGWDRDVACIALETDDGLVLIDPLEPPVEGPEQTAFWAELDALASPAPAVAIVLTVWWHERSAGHLFERYSKSPGATIWADERALDKFESRVTNPFRADSTLPGGIEAFDAVRGNEVVLWLPGPRALVAGDVLLGREGTLRLCPADWVGGEEGLAEMREALGRVLDLPIEIVLPSHGRPVLTGGRAAVEGALA
jgi:glyoxylase-like metal-dependent hydrolase (beta-lactamase superfamily II)